MRRDGVVQFLEVVPLLRAVSRTVRGLARAGGTLAFELGSLGSTFSLLPRGIVVG